jgi:hypothetical protein
MQDALRRAEIVAARPVNGRANRPETAKEGVRTTLDEQDGAPDVSEAAKGV